LTKHTAGTSFETDTWELYNLNVDPTETRNLAAGEPELLSELKSRWWAEAGK